jgi:hypothetical protein
MLHRNTHMYTGEALSYPSNLHTHNTKAPICAAAIQVGQRNVS